MSATPPSPRSPLSYPLPTVSLASAVNRFHLSPETIVLLLAVAIGGGTGLAVVLFHCLIAAVHSLLLEDLMGLIGAWGGWTLACIPVIGGLIVGLIRWRWQGFGLGISSLIVATQGYEVSPLQATAKAIAAAISLGSGASLGPEGPSVEIGSNIGIVLGQALQVSQERQQLLLGAGAAAGLAAGFNAPIAGIFFALEVVLGTTFAASAVSVILLAAVVAALVSQIGLGGQPAFTLPSYEVRSLLELPLYLGLGLWASLVSIAYTQSIKLAQHWFQGVLPGLGWMQWVPPILRPALGGLIVGGVALQFPQILGIGYETIEAMLGDVPFSLGLLIGLLVVKLIVTAISQGSGLVGGLFAPAMFLGASLGAAYGKVIGMILPFAGDEIAAPPAYAMVGMAAVLAGSARAPLTAILLLFELTRDYRIILPLMAAVGLSAWLVERLKPIAHNVSTAESTGLGHKGDLLDVGTEGTHRLLVAAAMNSEFLTLPATDSVIQAAILLTQQSCHSAIVIDEAARMVGIVTLRDIQRAITRWKRYPTASDQPLPEHLSPLLFVSDICTREVLSTFADEPLEDAVEQMAARGLKQLPVVDRLTSQTVIGLLRQEEIDLTYQITAVQEALQPLIAPSVTYPSSLPTRL
ncbi:MAG: chloride channel protein [Leptolyngbyaceae cyanobacterium]